MNLGPDVANIEMLTFSIHKAIPKESKKTNPEKKRVISIWSLYNALLRTTHNLGTVSSLSGNNVSKFYAISRSRPVHLSISHLDQNGESL